MRSSRLWSVLPALAVCGGFVALLYGHYRPLDVSIGQQAGRALLHGDLHVYGQRPDAQMGPVALMLAGLLPRALYVGVVIALLGVFLMLLPTARVVLLGGTLLAPPWAFFALEGHADDGLALLAMAGVLYAIRRHRPLAGVGWMLLGVAGKPTALVFLPLLLLLSWQALVAGGLLICVVWLPFLIADPHGMTRAGAVVSLMQPGSVPALLAPHGSQFPGWVRPTQFLVGFASTALAAVRRLDPIVAVVIAVTARALLEPGAWPSYSTSVIAAGLVADVYQQRRWPVAAVLGLASWMVAYTYPLDAGSGVLRAGLLLGVVALTVLQQRTVDVQPGQSGVPDETDVMYVAVR